MQEQTKMLRNEMADVDENAFHRLLDENQVYPKVINELNTGPHYTQTQHQHLTKHGLKS